jgi:hypothetical protein
MVAGTQMWVPHICQPALSERRAARGESNGLADVGKTEAPFPISRLLFPFPRQRRRLGYTCGRLCDKHSRLCNKRGRVASDLFSTTSYVVELVNMIELLQNQSSPKIRPGGGGRGTSHTKIPCTTDVPGATARSAAPRHRSVGTSPPESRRPPDPVASLPQSPP